MPVPAGGLGQHYAIDADEYFVHHEIKTRDEQAYVLLGEAESLIHSRGHLLDVGCGRGELLRAARDRGWSATGIELSSTFADYAEKHSQAEILRVPLAECAFPSQSFDVVILQAVLEHLYAPDAVIREISRILRPGGVLYTDVPNEEGLYARLGNMYQMLRGRDWVINLSPTFSPFHVFGFGRRSLGALLKKHHLQPEIWHIGGGACRLSRRAGVLARAEAVAAAAIAGFSNAIRMGTYLAVWSRKEAYA